MQCLKVGTSPVYLLPLLRPVNFAHFYVLLRPSILEFKRHLARRLSVTYNLEKVLPGSKIKDAEISNIPLLRFNGDVVYVDNEEESEHAAEELSKESVLGFDTEWKASFSYQTAEKENPVALIQLCSFKACYLFHVSNFTLTPTLRWILETPKIIKCGVGVKNDYSKLINEWGIGPAIESYLDLSELYAERLNEEIKNYGLAQLCYTCLQFELEKPILVQAGNWEKYPLDEQQKQYAACDAWAGLLLYRHLEAIPDASTERSQTVHRLAVQRLKAIKAKTIPIRLMQVTAARICLPRISKKLKEIHNLWFNQGWDYYRIAEEMGLSHSDILCQIIKLIRLGYAFRKDQLDITSEEETLVLENLEQYYKAIDNDLRRFRLSEFEELLPSDRRPRRSVIRLVIAILERNRTDEQTRLIPM